MNAGAARVFRPPPSGRHVMGALLGRELRLAFRRKVVRWLFVASLLPVLVFATILAVRIWGERNIGAALHWDPVFELLQVQLTPIVLLALAIGVPCVARDRAHDVLFLYATRPVQPAHYALGKWLAVALPAGGLLAVPALMIAGLRLGLLADVGVGETLSLVVRAAAAAVALGGAMAGVAIGASAAVKRDRMGYLLALGVMFVPDAVAEAATHSSGFAGPVGASQELLRALFVTADSADAALAVAVLAAYGAGGVGLAIRRVRREMVP